MLIITYSNGTLTPNQEITTRLFEQVGNTLVRVICEPKYYSDTHSLENKVCEFMNTFMPDDIEIRTSYVTINQSTGEDEKGKYVNSLDFQLHF